MKVRIKTGNLARTDELYGMYPFRREMQGNVYDADDRGFGSILVYKKKDVTYFFAAEDVEEIGNLELSIDVAVFCYLMELDGIPGAYMQKLAQVRSALEAKVAGTVTCMPADVVDYLVAKYVKDTQ